MDDSETYMNVQLVKSDSPSPSREDPDVSYVELHFKTLSVPRVRTNGDSLISTYSELNIGKVEPLIDEGEDPPIASGPGEMRVTAQTAAQERESKVKIGNRPYLLCLVTSAFIVTVASLSIYEQECSQDWIRNEVGCYFITTLKLPYDKARQYCCDSDSKLLDINSAEEENFVVKAVRDQDCSYWIGKCKDGKCASNVMFRMYGGVPECGVCTYYTELKPCDQVRARFICEKSAPLCPDISEKIRDLCQQPVRPT